MCTQEAEYSCSVHCNEPNSGPLEGNVADSVDVGCEKVVG